MLNPGPYQPTLLPTFSPTYENEIIKKSNINTIIAECDGGFGNRLRTLIFYMYYAEWKYDNAKLLFVWDINDACPGHFLEYFLPISNVNFITSDQSTKYELNENTIKFKNNRQNVDYYVDHYKTKIGPMGIWNLGMRKIILIDRLQKLIYNYIIENDICNSFGIHIRRTDLYELLKIGQRSSYEHIFYNINHKYPGNNWTMYLATDNAETQQIFLNYFNKNQNKISRVIMYHRIDKDIINKTTQIKKITSEFRHTTLEIAIIDAYILSYSKIFRRSLFSSYSEWVGWMRDLRKPEWRNLPTCVSENYTIIA